MNFIVRPLFTLLARAESNAVLLAPLTTEAAILRALLYADVFDYPLTLEEIHRYMVGENGSPEEVRTALDESPWLAGKVTLVGRYAMLADRTDLINLRQAREATASRLLKHARWFGAVIAHLPFVRMVAVTGALAMNNVDEGADIDYLIVTVPGRVWLGRAFAIAVVWGARLVGVNLCPNYILDSTALSQSRRDLFIAHELTQMTPLAGHGLYQAMRAVNHWTQRLLPNADTMPHADDDAAPRGFGLAWQRLLEWLLGGRVGDGLESWERTRKLAKFEAQLHKTDSAAVLDERQVKGHFDDYGSKALAAFAARCEQHGIPMSTVL